MSEASNFVSTGEGFRSCLKEFAKGWVALVISVEHGCLDFKYLLRTNGLLSLILLSNIGILYWILGDFVLVLGRTGIYPIRR